MVSIASLANPGQHSQSLQQTDALFGQQKKVSSEFQILDFIERLKSDCNGWKTCIERTAMGCDPEEHFILLSVIETYLMTRYAADDDGQETIRKWMRAWLHYLSSTENPPASYLAKKMAQLFALIFVVDFPKRWNNFMEEVFFENLTSTNITIFFLRTLIAIDYEVVEREIRRPKQVSERNNRIKDAMRDKCNPTLAMIWTQILAESGDVRVRELCLQVIACFIDWIDLELVVNNTTIPLIISRSFQSDKHCFDRLHAIEESACDLMTLLRTFITLLRHGELSVEDACVDFVQVFSDCLKNEHTFESAVSAVSGIVMKGMDSDKKFLLTSSLFSVLEENGFFAIKGNIVNEILRTGPLISSLGCALIECHSSFTKGGHAEKIMRCEALLGTQANIALSCLSSETVEASGTVLEFLRRYVSVLKTQQVSTRHDFARRLVYIAMDRYKAPSDVDLSNLEGQLETEFIEYRKHLRSILAALGNFEPETIMTKLEPLVQNMCQNWKQCDLTVTESTLALVYDLADFIHINLGTDSSLVSQRAKGVVIQVLCSSLTHCGVPYINVSFFEIVCRYERVVQGCAEAMSMILEAFLDSRGIRQTDLRTRSRTIYLFCRFIKAHKLLLDDKVENILFLLAPFFTEPPETNQPLSGEDRMYLYESTAMLIIHSSLPVVRKYECMKVLGMSLVQKILTISLQMTEAQSAEDAKQLRQQFADVIGCSARITKAFTISNTMQNCQCTTIFVDLMKVFLEGVSPNVEVLEALRQFLHRMVICLDSDILTLLPSICEKYLTVSDNLKVMHDFLILLQQIFVKFKKRILETGLNIPALFEILWAAQSTPVDATDENGVRDMIYFNRAYLQTILNILGNDLVELLINCGDGFIQKISDSIISFINSNDLATQRCTFQIVAKLFQKSPSGGSFSFAEFMWEKAVCAGLQIPLSEKHDLIDAQCILLQHEIYACLQILRSYNSERFDQCLQIFIPSDFVQKFRYFLLHFKGKQLDKELDKLYDQIKRMKSNGSEGS